jgi:ABC-type nickel/cobalt efflux system permease component RcnA
MTGLMWGLGHTVILLITGIIILALKIVIPKTIALSLEFIVGIMIIILGINVIYNVFKKKHPADKEYGQAHTNIQSHEHFHSHDKFHIHMHEHSHNIPNQPNHNPNNSHSHNHQPLIVGIIHGLAGSASLMLLILASIDSMFIGILYIAVFGLGTIISMAILASIMSLPFVLTSKKFTLWNKRIKIAIGIFSIMFGLYIMYRIIFFRAAPF